ncbi:MAG: hypothetical protein R2788_16100 [Saprospiraceae bacterium]
MKIFALIIRLLVAVILLQTLYFKFTASPESVYIFEQTGLGAAGRIGSGIAELIAAILILVPSTSGLAYNGIGHYFWCYIFPFNQAWNRSARGWRNTVLPGVGCFLGKRYYAVFGERKIADTSTKVA